eukprot:6681358-Lingulodinium_polyedra.AAC.1
MHRGRLVLYALVATAWRARAAPMRAPPTWRPADGARACRERMLRRRLPADRAVGLSWPALAD